MLVTDFCLLMLTTMVCLLILVIVCDAFGIPQIFERMADALERIADALDRGHIQKFSDFSIKLQQNHLLIQTKNIKNTVLEKVALSEKAEMFEGVFGYKVLLD